MLRVACFAWALIVALKGCLLLWGIRLPYVDGRVERAGAGWPSSVTRMHRWSSLQREA
jgi:hypothetical protein